MLKSVCFWKAETPPQIDDYVCFTLEAEDEELVWKACGGLV